MGIFGGTFDPVHRGHLAIAETALREVNLAQVIWVPVSQPAHKKLQFSTSFEERRQMVRLAIADYPKFILLEPEIVFYYAIEILDELQKIYPNREWYWIIGVDSFLTFPKWYKREHFCEAVEWLVAPRSSVNCAESMDVSTVKLCTEVANRLAAESLSVRWQVLQTGKLVASDTKEISSSKIRRYCFLGQKIDDYVPESVNLYIKNNNLYNREQKHK